MSPRQASAVRSYAKPGVQTRSSHPFSMAAEAQEVHRCNERQRLGSGDLLLLRENVLRQKRSRSRRMIPRASRSPMSRFKPVASQAPTRFLEEGPDANPCGPACHPGWTWSANSGCRVGGGWDSKPIAYRSTTSFVCPASRSPSSNRSSTAWQNDLGFGMGIDREHVHG